MLYLIIQIIEMKGEFMSNIYTRKGWYKDTGAGRLAFLSVALVCAGLGCSLISIMAVFDPDMLEDMAFKFHIYTGYILFFFGVYCWTAALRRAYDQKKPFSIHSLGILLIILQVLTIIDVIFLGVTDSLTSKDIILCPIPAVLCLPVYLRKCTRKARTISFVLIGYAVVYLLTDIDKLIHEIPGEGLQSVLYALLIVWLAFILRKRVKKFLTDQDEAVYF